MLEEKTETNGRLLARLVWELLKAESFESLADLTDALKFRCARLRIRWTNDEIGDAFRLIASNTELVARPRPRRDEPAPEPKPIRRDEAPGLIAMIQTHTDTAATIRTIAPAAWSDPEQAERAEQAARQRASEMGISW